MVMELAYLLGMNQDLWQHGSVGKVWIPMAVSWGCLDMEELLMERLGTYFIIGPVGSTWTIGNMTRGLILFILSILVSGIMWSLLGKNWCTKWKS